MSVTSEQDLQRELALKALVALRQMVWEFSRLRGEEIEFEPIRQMSTSDMLAELADTLMTVQGYIGPALEHPMLKPLMRMVGKG